MNSLELLLNGQLKQATLEGEVSTKLLASHTKLLACTVPV